MERLDQLAGLIDEVGNTTRLRLLLVLGDGAKTPGVLNEQLGRRETDMARTAYHIRALHARGLIEEIRPRLSRGARQREYSLTGDGRHVLQLATKLLG